MSAKTWHNEHINHTQTMSKKEGEKIVITHQAFQMLDGGLVVQAEPWDQLVKVTAYKLDLLAMDHGSNQGVV